MEELQKKKSVVIWSVADRKKNKMDFIRFAKEEIIIIFPSELKTTADEISQAYLFNLRVKGRLSQSLRTGVGVRGSRRREEVK